MRPFQLFKIVNDRLLALLSRRTSSGTLVPEIDGLRFVAIGAVVFHHLMATHLVTTHRYATPEIPSWEVAAQRFGPLVALASHGNFGVQLFFVISGFILAIPFARHRFFSGDRSPSLKAYYLRRLWRLEPPYIINMLILFYLRFAMHGLGAQYLPYLAASLIYSHSMIYKEVSRISDITWSLEVEVQFYVLVPLFASIFLIRHMWLRRTLLLGAIAFLGFFPLVSLLPRLASTLNLLGQVQFFLTGFLLADFYLLDWKDSRKTLLGDGFSVVGAALILWIIMTATFAQALAWLPLPILLFYIGVFRGTVSNWIFTRRWIVVIGGMCYTIYLYHNEVIYRAVPLIERRFATTQWSVGAGFAWQALLVIPILLAICAALFLLFEKPFMNSARRALPR